MRRLLLSAFLLSAGAAGAARATVLADNLIPNGDFSTDLSGWTVTSGGITATWVDDPLAIAGAMEVVNTDAVDFFGYNVVESTCIPVTAGTLYEFGTGYRNLGGDRPSSVLAFVLWSTSGDCSGAASQSETERTDGLPNAFTAVTDFATAPAGAHSARLRLGLRKVGDGGSTTVRFDFGLLRLGATCSPAWGNTLCVGVDGRFRMRSAWDLGTSGFRQGQAFGLTQDSGGFWILNRDNVEVLAKVLNACDLAYWVFLAGLTDFGVTVTVEDTATQDVRTYATSLGQAFPPIKDFAAFACP
ncbi:MAG: hypothetical protein U0X73_08215 [Thermoanaerobaculia bacterium]